MMSVLVSLFLALGDTARSRAALQLELLALRHQLQVLERSRRCRPRLSQADRLLWVWLWRVWHEWREALAIVKPGTSPARHRGVTSEILRYDIIRNDWRHAGHLGVLAPVTLPTAPWRNGFVLFNGEVQPGGRTTQVFLFLPAH